MTKIQIPPYCELLRLYQKHPLSFIAKKYNVSDPTVKKWFVRFQIPLRPHRENQIKFAPFRLPLDDSLLRERYESGETVAVLAKSFGCSNLTIRKRLVQAGISIRNPLETQQILHRQRYDSEQIVGLYQSNLSLLEIGELLGLAPSTARKILIENGVELRSAHSSQQLSVAKGSKTKLEKYGYPHFRTINKSQGELELLDFLNSLQVGKFVSDQSVLDRGQLDAFCETKRVAFEYCGIYWHSELFKDKNHHWHRMKQCQEKNIRLFTIFEDEWLERKPQVQNYIRSALGDFDLRYFARDVLSQPIEPKDARAFCSFNHIQGGPNRVRLAQGLFDPIDRQLLAVMTIANHHRKESELVLNRLCFAPGVQIVGGASRLFRGITETNQLKRVRTWSDNRWSEGRVYSRMGFSLIEELKPDYSYAHPNSVQRRSKQSMKKSSTGCPPEQTEKDWCRERGWYRIWDCGKKAWEWSGE